MRNIDTSYGNNLMAEKGKKKRKPMKPTIQEMINAPNNTRYMGNVYPIGQTVPQVSSVPPTNGTGYMSNLNATGTSAGTESATPEPTLTPSTSGQTPVKYEEWLANSQTAGYIDAARDAAIKNAEAIAKRAEAAAEQERQRAIIDARSSYAQNLAEYGAKGEAIRDMGLTGSGYGEYLSSQAYSQQRGDIQHANTTANIATSDAQYLADQTKFEAEQKANADKYNAYKDISQKQTETYMQILDSISYGENIDTGLINNLLSQEMLTQGMYDDIKNRINRRTEGIISEAINPKTEDLTIVDNAFRTIDQQYESGNITKEVYQAQYARLAEKIIELELNAEYTPQTIKDIADMIDRMDENYASGKLSESEYNRLKGLTKTVGTGTEYAISKWSRHIADKQEISIKIGSDSDGIMEYKLKYNSKQSIDDKSAISVLNKLASKDGRTDTIPTNESLVVLGGKMYAYHHGKWRLIESDASVNSAVSYFIKINKNNKPTTNKNNEGGGGISTKYRDNLIN